MTPKDVELQDGQQPDVAHGEELVAQPHGVSEEDLKRLQSEKDALFDRFARLQAEFENFRKRAAKENAEYREYATSDVARALLPLIDHLDLALRSSSNDSELLKGVELIRRQFDDVLAKMNVTAVPAVGAEFDPRVHEAIEMVASDNAQDGEVIDELQRGYKMRDRLLRPARVRVAKRN